MQPSPRAETSSPIFPSLRVCIASPPKNLPTTRRELDMTDTKSRFALTWVVTSDF